MVVWKASLFNPLYGIMANEIKNDVWDYHPMDDVYNQLCTTEVGVICGVVRKAGQINLVKDANLSKNQPSKCKLTSNNFLGFNFLQL